MPTAAELRYKGRAALKGRWGIALLVCLVAAILGGMDTGFNFNFHFDINNNYLDLNYLNLNYANTIYYAAGNLAYLLAMLAPFMLIVAVAQLIIGASTHLGLCLYFCKLHRGQDAQLGDLFGRFNIFGRALWLRIVMGVKIFLWTLLLVIPGIIAAYRYSMAPYLMAENPDLTASQAIEMSCYMMDGNKGSLFVLHLSFIGWAILCTFSLGIGYLWLNPYMQSSEAAFFLELLSRKSPYARNEQHSDSNYYNGNNGNNQQYAGQQYNAQQYNNGQYNGNPQNDDIHLNGQ